MNAIQGQTTWLPALLQDKDAGTGITGVLWNASGLVVKYQKQGNGVQTKTLASTDWSEGIDGSYNIKFSADELNTLGLFSYWLSHPSSTTYPGAVTVVAALTDVASEISLEQVAQTVGTLPTDVASSGDVSAIQASVASATSQAESATTAATLAGTKADGAKSSADAATDAALVAADKADAAKASADAAKVSADAIALAIDSLPTTAAVSDVSSAVAALQSAVSNLPTDVSDNADVIALAEMITTIQGAVGSLASSTASSLALDNVISSVNTLQEVVNGLPTNTDMSEALSAVAQAVNDLNSRVNQTDDSLSSLASLVSTLHDKIGGIVGPGTQVRTARIVLSGVPANGVQCWVTSDSIGRTTIAGPTTTNSNGEAQFYLEAGDYWLFWVGRGVKSGSSKWEVRDD
jgi:hypothetical protein